MAKRASRPTSEASSSVAVRRRGGKPSAPTDERADGAAARTDAHWRRQIVVEVLAETLVHKRLLEVTARLEKEHAAN
jgi:hypothetical protein